MAPKFCDIITRKQYPIAVICARYSSAVKWLVQDTFPDLISVSNIPQIILK